MWTIDFETEGIVGNALVNPPRPIGVGIKRDDMETMYISGSLGQMRKPLECIWASGEEMIFQNAPFDLAVASQWLGLDRPKWDRIHDTQFLLFLNNPHAKTLSLKPSAEALLGWAPLERDELKEWIIENVRGAGNKNWGKYICRAPEELVAKYCKVDCDMTWALFTKLYTEMPRAPYDLERELQPYLSDATVKGMRCDRKRLAKDLITAEYNYKCAKLRIYEILGDFDMSKPAQLADALEKAGKVIEWKFTPTGKRSTARANLLASVADPELLALLSYVGALNTCISTFMKPWLVMSEQDGRLHPSWNQVRDDDFGTRTGRFSCNGPNLTNVPTEFDFATPEGLHPIPTMRSYLLPEPGQVWVSRDFSSQEMRILAHYEDGVLMEAFQANPELDPHSMVQQLILAKTGIKLLRKYVKGIGFGLIYGMGANGLSKQLGVSLVDARQMIEAYHLALPGVGANQRGTKHRAKMGLPIRTLGGREYYCEPPKISGCSMRTFDYKLLNYLIQGSAADQTKTAMLAYFRQRPAGQTFLCAVHDEINISVPNGAGDMPLRACMESGDFMDVPMRTTVKVGETWGDIA
jgi:DNA polymerase I-like protein with 3'-5' exonuclease and polymerase domains